jgi:hypothetical protein
VLNFIAFQRRGDLKYSHRNYRHGLGGAPMESLIESAANKAGVPSEVLDLMGRDYISQLIKDLPSLLLPPVMADLKKVVEKRGVGWIRDNVSYLQKHFGLLKQMYGPVENEEFQKPDYHHIVLP